MSYRIAVIDDEDKILSQYKSFLADKYNIKLYNNPFSLIKEYSPDKYDLIITDLVMPKMDGIKLIKNIKQRNPMQKFLVVSGYLNDKVARRIAEIGIDYMLSKPVTKEQLIESIEFLLSRKDEETPVTGKVKIDLPTLLSVVGFEKGSARIKVVSREGEGEIYIQDGNLIRCNFGDLTGVDALKKILSLKSYFYEQLPFKNVKPEVIAPIEFILMESSRQIDEETRNLGEKQKEIIKSNEQDSEVTKVEQILQDIFGTSLLNIGIVHISSSPEVVFKKGDKGDFMANFISIFNTYHRIEKEIGYPPIKEYVLIQLANQNLLILATIENFLLGMEISSNELETGYLINVGIPDFFTQFKNLLTR